MIPPTAAAIIVFVIGSLLSAPVLGFTTRAVKRSFGETGAAMAKRKPLSSRSVR
jgi:hypothetical protein